MTNDFGNEFGIAGWLALTGLVLGIAAAMMWW